MDNLKMIEEYTKEILRSIDEARAKCDDEYEKCEQHMFHMRQAYLNQSIAFSEAAMRVLNAKINYLKEHSKEIEITA